MSKILDRINSPADLKELNIQELSTLCAEIREFLVDNVSKTGGHLAPNLGVVELTVALHYIFDTPSDKIVFDVGHQTYVNKILTGRKDKFDTLRQLDGLSGFPKPYESEFDVFNTGHSSTSISQAIGIAVANKLSGSPNYSIAVIGDGALTGGLAFEGLNNANIKDTNLIVVLNDNQMSIAQSVGGLSTYLSKIRSNTFYNTSKRDIKEMLKKFPLLGKPIHKIMHEIKTFFRTSLMPKGRMFEHFGFTYLGPIDGNNIEAITEFLERAKNVNKPVLLHIVTRKGMGYEYAEKNPNKFHGIGPFNKDTGETLKASSMSYSKRFGMTMCEEAEKNDKLIAITAAMPDGVGLCEFKQKYPDRFFDVGIAEGHATTFAGSLALQGYTPVFACYSTFLQRAYDEIIHDVALQNAHVIFAIDRAGIVGQDGETHQGLLDESYLNSIPNMTVMAPKDGNELDEMIKFAIRETGPIAIRYPRDGYTDEIKTRNNIRVEKGKAQVLKKGKDVTIIGYGKTVKKAEEVSTLLNQKGVHAEVINARFLKPFDNKTILDSIKKTKFVVTIEDAYLKGGIASNVQELIAKENDIKSLFLGYPDEFIKHGKTDEIEKIYKLDKESIFNSIVAMMPSKKTKKKTTKKEEA